MAWVYILKGSSGRHYIGSTTDLARRLAEHRNGHTATTRRLGTCLEVVAAREYPTLDEARAVERSLKRMKRPDYAIEWLRQPHA